MTLTQCWQTHTMDRKQEIKDAVHAAAEIPGHHVVISCGVGTDKSSCLLWLYSFCNANRIPYADSTEIGGPTRYLVGCSVWNNICEAGFGLNGGFSVPPG